jgi:hypothetical protein
VETDNFWSNSPLGEYGLLYDSQQSLQCGLIFYKQGLVLIDPYRTALRSPLIEFYSSSAGTVYDLVQSFESQSIEQVANNFKIELIKFHSQALLICIQQSTIVQQEVQNSCIAQTQHLFLHQDRSKQQRLMHLVMLRQVQLLS